MNERIHLLRVDGRQIYAKGRWFQKYSWKGSSQDAWTLKQTASPSKGIKDVKRGRLRDTPICLNEVYIAKNAKKDVERLGYESMH